MGGHHTAFYPQNESEKLQFTVRARSVWNTHYCFDVYKKLLIAIGASLLQ